MRFPLGITKFYPVEILIDSEDSMTPLQEIFIPIFCVGALVSAVMALIGGRMSGAIGPLILLLMSALVCWFALFLGLEVGYQVWQSGPDPPSEAFSDTDPMGALLAGWIPAGFFACFWFGISWLIKKFVWNPKVGGLVGVETSVGLLDAELVETGNAYQPPAS